MKNPLRKNLLIILAFAVNIGLTLFGFITLLDSPYTGIRMSVCGDHACVKSVDKGSPADGNVQAGDNLIDVNDLSISYLVFNEDPDYLQSERDFWIFWKSAYMLHERIASGRPLKLSLERSGRSSVIAVTPVHFPLFRAIYRTGPIYIVGWVFFIVAFLIYRKKANETSVVFFLMGGFVCGSWTSGIPFAVRDISFPYSAFRILNRTDFVSALLLVCAFFHFALIFPQKVMRPGLHKWIVRGLYLSAATLVLLRFTDAIENTYLTTYIPYSFCLVGVAAVYLYGYVTVKNPTIRTQSKWVMFGMTVPMVCYAGFSSFPILFGASFVSVEISSLAAIALPLSFAFAITRYRLMEIDAIIDTTVVYGFTIAVLAAIETAFLSFASPYLLAAGRGLPALSVIAVLLIVFIYVPVRNVVKGVVERLFRRGKYNPEIELQQFMLRLGLCDEQSALDKFAAFVKELLKPSGIVVLKIGGRAATILHASNDLVRQEEGKITAQIQEVWEHVRSKGTCTFGYELSEKIGQGGFLFTSDLESALFVPFITDSADTGSGYLAVLLKKWNGTAYAAKDVTLLNAISVNIANIIEAGELRKERARIEERHRREKDAVMKELHDGLGNILTSITVTSQAAERLMDGSRQQARSLIDRISGFSDEAVEFLRTGLTVLDHQRSALGAMTDGVSVRFAPLFGSAGMELRIECADDARNIRPGAVVIMHIVRIIQEALTNVMKHAGAKRARVELVRVEAGLAVTVTDNGKGFDVMEKHAGYGLTNMRRRVKEMAGAVEVHSSPDEGTKISIILPLAERTAPGEDIHAAGNR